MVVAVVFLVAVFAGPRRGDIASAAGWTFEPFSQASRVGGNGGWLRSRYESVDDETSSLPAPSLIAPPSSRDRLVTYIVQPGDTVFAISRAYGLSSETLLWANDLGDADLIAPGDRLRVPPGNGVLHTVRPGDTLKAIAERYSVEVAAVANHRFNQIGENGLVSIGRDVFVPGGAMPRPVARPAASPAPAAVSQASSPARPTEPPVAQRPTEPVARPTPAPAPVPVAPPPARPALNVSVPPSSGVRLGWPAAGNLTQGYGGGHRGIDIVAPTGTPVFAAGDGVVITAAAGWNGGFGDMIEIDHGNGVISRYAHLSAIHVAPGQRVSRGLLIGKIGTSGIVTAPHLHFEVLSGGVRSDPMGYLR